MHFRVFTPMRLLPDLPRIRDYLARDQTDSGKAEPH